MLKVQNLNIKSDKAELVHDISFGIAKGEIVTLLGESGSGKSLTAMSIIDLLPQGISKRGDIMIDGLPFAANMRGAAVSIIMQAPASCFSSVFSMQTQWNDILHAHGKPTDQQSQAYPFQLSGGTLQRMMIELAIKLDTPLIIADEPTSDLDSHAQLEVIDLLLSTKRKDRAMLVITHDIAVALRMADRILVMQAGCLVDSFAIADIHAQERHEYTKTLLAANESLSNNHWRMKYA